jgi:glycosyltransferase involved in cell wall biosynthesis
MISIVIPVYNENEYLAQALLSLGQQTAVRRAEILIVEYDPQRTSRSREIIKEFYDLYHIPIKIVDVDRPGIAFTRHEGIMQSKGDIVCNFDADSRFSDAFCLERMTSLIEDGTAVLTDCDMVFDYTSIPPSRLEDMYYPQMVLDGLNRLQRTTPMAVLEPGSCISKAAYIESDGFADVDKWELFNLSARMFWLYPSMIRHIKGVEVISSPRRVLKLSELGIETLNYSKAIRKDKIMSL